MHNGPGIFEIIPSKFSSELVVPHDPNFMLTRPVLAFRIFHADAALKERENAKVHENCLLIPLDAGSDFPLTPYFGTRNISL